MSEQKYCIIEPKSERGYTNYSKRFFLEYYKKIGEITKIELIPVREDNFSPITKFIGDKGDMLCFGFYWGYGGEGPSGLRWAISKIFNWDYYSTQSYGLRPFISGKHMDKPHTIDLLALKRLYTNTPL